MSQLQANSFCSLYIKTNLYKKHKNRSLKTGGNGKIADGDEIKNPTTEISMAGSHLHLVINIFSYIMCK